MAKNPVDAATLNWYKTNEPTRMLVDAWIEKFEQNPELSIVDFVRAVKLTVFFLANKSKMAFYKQLKQSSGGVVENLNDFNPHLAGDMCSPAKVPSSN